MDKKIIIKYHVYILTPKHDHKVMVISINQFPLTRRNIHSVKCPCVENMAQVNVNKSLFGVFTMSSTLTYVRGME